MNKTGQEIRVTPIGDTLIVREGQAPEIFDYQGFKYTADSTDSLIALAESKANKDNCVIAYNEKGFKVILDDKIIDRPQDRLDYCYKKSQQYQEWAGILEKGTIFDQKNLIDFLKRREPGEIEDAETFMAAVKNFKYVTNIAGDFTYDDRNNYTLAVKVGDAEGTIKLPQTITAKIEIYNESGLFQDMEIELEIEKPKGEGEKLLFKLTCPKLARYLKDAAEYEVEKVKRELDGYLIVAGNI